MSTRIARLGAKDQLVPGGPSKTIDDAVDKVMDLIAKDRFADAKALSDILGFDFGFIIVQSPGFRGKWRGVAHTTVL